MRLGFWPLYLNKADTGGKSSIPQQFSEYFPFSLCIIVPHTMGLFYLLLT